MLRRLASEGCSILYISHKLDEIQALCQTATVMRGGRVTGSVDPRKETHASLAQLMVGHSLPDYTRREHTPGEVKLAVKNLSVTSADPFRHVAQGTFRSPCMQEKFSASLGCRGMDKPSCLPRFRAKSAINTSRPDAITIVGQPAARYSAGGRRALGFAFVPEERLGRGAVPAMSLAENALLTGHREHMVRGGWISTKSMRAFADRCISAFDVRCGGNGALAQSPVRRQLAEVHRGPRDPAGAEGARRRATDMGASMSAQPASSGSNCSIWPARGVAILVISEELEELFDICDRPRRPCPRQTFSGSRNRPHQRRRNRPLHGGSLRWQPRRTRRPRHHGIDIMNFPYRLEARPTPSRAMQLAVPVVAAVLTLIIGFLIFTLVGQDPLRAMHGFFIEPLSNVNGWSELVLKASPLCLIALGLAVGYRANVWNIGAEGQMLLGGIVAGGIAIHLPDATGWWILPLMMIGGVIGGMVWAAIPALLKSRFNTNEILTSLMLTYVATQLPDLSGERSVA